jgi:hypothetical protein
MYDVPVHYFFLLRELLIDAWTTIKAWPNRDVTPPLKMKCAQQEWMSS